MRNILTLAALLVPLAATAAPRVPQVTLSGELRDAVGNPVTGDIKLNVRLYANEATPVGGEFHLEAFTAKVKDGFFKVVLGSTTPLDPAKLDIDPTNPAAGVFVGLQVEGEGEMAPRIKLTSSPWALSVDWSGVTSKPPTYTATPHRHPWTELDAVPAGFADGKDDGVVTATAPLLVAGSTVSLSAAGCTSGQILKLAGTTWGCAADANAGGTVTSVSASAPLAVTNGTTTPQISITQAGSTTAGFLSAADWNTFNNKAPASGSPNYAPATGSANYAPASGSPNYAPATGSASYIQNQSAANQNANLRISGSASFLNGILNIAGNGVVTASNTAGNLHLDTDDTKTDGRIYFDWNSGRGTRWGNGNQVQVGEVDSAGNAKFNGTLTMGSTASFSNGAVKVTASGISGNDAAGNLHLSSTTAGTDGRVYLNWNAGKGVAFGNGASGVSASIDNAGNFDSVGTVHGGGASGTAFEVGNDAALVDVDQANTVNLRGLQSAAGGVLTLGSGATVRLDAAGDSYFNGGRLGIGAATTPYKLSVGNAAPAGNTLARFGDSDHPVYVISPKAGIGFNAYYAGGWKYGVTPAGGHGAYVAIAYGTGETPRLSLGITPTPGATDAVISTFNQALNVFADGSVGIGGVNVASASDLIVTSSGAHLTRAGSWANASSRTFKREIQTFEGALPLLDRVRVVSYRYREDHGDDGKRHVGVIAEELPDEVAALDKKSAPTADLIALALGANKELKTQLDALAQRSAAQERALDELRAELRALKQPRR